MAIVNTPARLRPQQIHFFRAACGCIAEHHAGGAQ